MTKGFSPLPARGAGLFCIGPWPRALRTLIALATLWRLLSPGAALALESVAQRAGVGAISVLTARNQSDGLFRRMAFSEDQEASFWVGGDFQRNVYSSSGKGQLGGGSLGGQVPWGRWLFGAALAMGGGFWHSLGQESFTGHGFGYGAASVYGSFQQDRWKFMAALGHSWVSSRPFQVSLTGGPPALNRFRAHSRALSAAVQVQRSFDAGSWLLAPYAGFRVIRGRWDLGPYGGTTVQDFGGNLLSFPLGLRASAPLFRGRNLQGQLWLEATAVYDSGSFNRAAGLEGSRWRWNSAAGLRVQWGQAEIELYGGWQDSRDWRETSFGCSLGWAF